MRKQFFKGTDEYLIWVGEEIRKKKLSTNSVSLLTALRELDLAMKNLVEIEKNLKEPVLEYANKLLSGDPLFPIEENDECWEPLGDNMFQNTRWRSLYKQIDETGSAIYVDQKRFEIINVDIGTRGRIVQNNFVTSVMNIESPISFPYIAPTRKHKVYIQAFNVGGYVDHNINGANTLGILYVEDSKGNLIEIKRFFKENHVTKEMEEIPFVDYAFRRKRYEDNKEKLEKKG